ncbi:hypothetical protein Q8A73_018079 [Channa argus]|nr:hypothetical protein Q8A73_018079 [Channa argus]
MNLQDQNNSLLEAIMEFVESLLEFARGQTEKLEDQYVSANRNFEEGLKERSLDPSGSSGQFTGECSPNVSPEKRHLLAEMRNRLARRDELLAQVENLEAQRAKETIHHLQTHRKLLDILIQCERQKKKLFQNLYGDNVTVCQMFIPWLYRSIGETIRPIQHRFDQSPQEQNLLAEKTGSSCWRYSFDQRKSSDTETQKTVSDLLSTLETLDKVLEGERLETEKYKRQYQGLMHEYKNVSNTMKQRKSSCKCGPDVTPELHTTECKIRFTQDDEDLLDTLDECAGEIMDNVAEVEKQAEEEVEVFTRKVRQKAAENQWDCMWICSAGNRCEQDPDNHLRSKLKLLKDQVKYERDRAEKFEQLRWIVGLTFEDWTKVENQVGKPENQLVETETQSKEETAAVGQGHEVRHQSSNKPLLPKTKTLSVDKDKPAEPKSTEESLIVNVKQQVDTSEEDERTSESPSVWLSNNIVKGVCFGLGAAVGVGVLAARRWYFR